MSQRTDAALLGFIDGASGVVPQTDDAEYRRFYAYGKLARRKDDIDRAFAEEAARVERHPLEPSIDYPPRPRPAPSIPRPAPVTGGEFALAVVCLIGVFGFGMALAAGLVSIAERLAVAP